MLQATSTRRFAAVLALLVVLGGGLRVAYVLAVTQHEDTGLYDATWYELSARVIAEGEGFFDDPFLLLERPGAREPNADHPPLTVLAMVPAALLGPGEPSNRAMRLTSALFGTGTIALVGLLGRRIAGDTAGLVAAGIAVVNPHLWINDGLVMSESLATLLTVGVLYGVYRVLDGDRSLRWAAALGALVALSALTRAELLLWGPLLVLPALLVTRHERLLPRVAATGAAGLLLLGPWVAFNMARFEHPTTVSTGLGLALRSGNCDTTYHGEQLGFSEVFPPCTPLREGREPSALDAELRDDALSYMRANLGRAPVVALARVGRIWNVYRVGQSAELSTMEGRPEWATWMAAVTTWVTVPLAVVGGVALRRRRFPVWPLVVSVLATTMVVVGGLGGLLRYRAPSEPALVALAAVGALVLLARFRPGRDEDAGGDPEAAAGEADGVPADEPTGAPAA